MRRTIGALLALGMWCCLGSAASAQSSWVGGSTLEGRLVVGANGETWVGVWVDAPQIAVAPAARAPMAVSLVIDTSGSMAGDKITNARMAASSLIESLADGDIVSIYGFSNDVTEVASPTMLSPSSRSELMRRVSMLVAGGGTNLYAGMQVGVSRIQMAPASHSVRRIFLISDGRANIGPSDPTTLGDLAAGATEWGTQVTAIGVGYDYDPQTLNSMVVRSAGRLHHLGAPQQMASILEQELTRLSRAVALNAHVIVEPAPGVVILDGATTGAVVEGGRLRFSMGAMDAGQRREILFRVRITDTAHTGARTLATVRFGYERPNDRVEQTQLTAVRYEVTRDRHASTPTPRVAAMVAEHQANEAQRRAAQAMADGQRERAERELATARAQLDQAAVTFSDDAVVGARLRGRAAAVAGDEERARTSTTSGQMRERSYELQAAPMAAEGY